MIIKSSLLKITPITYFLTSLFIFTVSPCSAQGQEPAYDINALVEEVRIVLNKHSIDISQEERRDILRKMKIVFDHDSENYQLHTQMVRYLLNMAYKVTNEDYSISYDEQQLQFAKPILDKILAAHPDYADVYVLYGMYLHGVGDYQTADEVYYKKAEELRPNNPYLYVRWGITKLALKDETQAVEKFTRAIEYYEQDIEDNPTDLGAAYDHLAGINARNGNYELADKYYHKVMELLPTSPWIRGTYAEFLRTYIGDIDGAIKYGEEAIAIADYSVVRFTLGFAYYAKIAQLIEQDVPVEQINKVLERANALYPKTHLIYTTLGGNDKTTVLIPFLISRGMPVNTVNDAGYSVLNFAASQNQEKAAINALKHKVDPNLPGEDGWTPFLNAADNGNLTLVKAILGTVGTIHKQYYDVAIGFCERDSNQELKKYLIERFPEYN